MKIKMIDDLIAEYGDEETKKAYEEYCNKLDKAPAPCSFIICSAELAKVLESVI
jgi:hypothetical protein